MNRSHELRCRRCGAVVTARTIHGESAESCICLIRYAHERVPTAWKRQEKHAAPTAD